MKKGKSWQQFETQVFEEFQKRYPNQQIEMNQKIVGRYSGVKRQIDILIKASLADSIQIGVFDCKKFKKQVDVKTVDSMIGFMDDLHANYGGIVTCIGFTKAAIERAKGNNIKLEIIEFKSAEELVKHFMPSLDFSDPRNSMYINVIL